MKKISIDQEKCIGCGFCENCNPNLFKINQDSFKAEIVGDLSLEDIEEVKKIIDNCPVKAIKIE
ncbi:MAG: ferredoxin [Candidatus Zambryskibacteria bacterium]|nr:ferredoxin [Candidatus Zambryskibacteria bacterium]